MQSPKPPQESRTGPPRPSPAAPKAHHVQMSVDTIRSLCASMRTNNLLGAAAAQALESAAGLDVNESVQGSSAMELRRIVADTRLFEGNDKVDSVKEGESEKPPDDKKNKTQDAASMETADQDR